jgi:hypothetical protein
LAVALSWLSSSAVPAAIAVGGFQLITGAELEVFEELGVLEEPGVFEDVEFLIAVPPHPTRTGKSSKKRAHGCHSVKRPRMSVVFS